MQATQTPTLVPLAFAANGTKNTIPEASQIGITAGAASLNDGFPPLTFTPIAAGGVPPAGADFNGILNLLSQTIRWKHAGGQFGYNAAFAGDTNVGGYPRGALLLRADQSGMWLNLTDNNATNPDTGGAGWSAAFMSGVVGQARNVVMSVAAASATATLTADEIVVSTALGGQKYVLGAFNKTVNLATTGAGGMDTGSAPATGYVALYAIYNPTTQTAALLATNAASKVNNVYGGANMPSGYTASALVSVWKMNASGQFQIGLQRDRRVSVPQFFAVNNSSTPPSSFAALSLAVPPNSTRVFGELLAGSSSAATLTLLVAADTSATGQQACVCGGGSISGTCNYQLDLVTAQQMYWTGNASSGTPNMSIGISGWEF